MEVYTRCCFVKVCQEYNPCPPSLPGAQAPRRLGTLDEVMEGVAWLLGPVCIFTLFSFRADSGGEGGRRRRWPVCCDCPCPWLGVRWEGVTFCVCAFFASFVAREHTQGLKSPNTCSAFFFALKVLGSRIAILGFFQYQNQGISFFFVAGGWLPTDRFFLGVCIFLRCVFHWFASESSPH